MAEAFARRQKAEEPYLDAAAVLELKRASEIVEGIEQLLSRYRLFPNLPLTLVDRCERALAQTHAHNLKRLPAYSRLDTVE